MGKKVHPQSVRLGINKTWSSQWFSRISKGHLQKYQGNLKEDLLIREYLKKQLKNAAVENIIIKRSAHQLTIVIHTARPGLVIGKNGKEIERLRKEINKLIKGSTALKIDLQEVRNPETYSALIVQSIAEQLEKRFPYRRVMKKTLSKISLNQQIQGVKIKLSGRLNGAEIARSEWLAKGKVPLQTFSADIDYCQGIAKTVYGTIGIKVWLYKKAAKNTRA